MMEIGRLYELVKRAMQKQCEDYSDAELNLLLRYANDTLSVDAGSDDAAQDRESRRRRSPGRSTQASAICKASVGGLRGGKLGGCRPVRLPPRHAPHGGQIMKKCASGRCSNDEAFADCGREGARSQE